MYKNKKILAVIPARANSKGLPGKNVKMFHGKPMIAWAISAARASRYIDKVVVSTDGRKISAISKKYGADVPFLRPKNLSSDTASSVDVLLHAADFLKEMGDSFDIFVLLQPTSPLRKVSDIDGAIEALFRKRAEKIVSVAKASHSPLWMNRLLPDGSMRNFMPKRVAGKTRQALPEYFMPNGAIFLGYLDSLRSSKEFYGKGTYAYIMPRERSVDIDDMVDFKLAETLFI